VILKRAKPRVTGAVEMLQLEVEMNYRLAQRYVRAGADSAAGGARRSSLLASGTRGVMRVQESRGGWTRDTSMFWSRF
jgi:hypothetical protein